MKRKTQLMMSLLPILILASSHSTAVTVKGVDIPDEVILEQNTLVLNGAGIRSKFVFDIYIGALYLAKKQSTADAIINDPGPQQVSMHFVYDEVSAEKMRNGWNDGFANVLNEDALKKLQPQIESFNQAFGNTVAGDVIHVQYTPKTGTTVVVNNTTKASIPRYDFHQALMKIWLGNDPVDADLKQGMLGKNKAD